jgi:hypothetical protein
VEVEIKVVTILNNIINLPLSFIYFFFFFSGKLIKNQLTKRKQATKWDLSLTEEDNKFSSQPFKLHPIEKSTNYLVVINNIFLTFPDNHLSYTQLKNLQTTLW